MTQGDEGMRPHSNKLMILTFNQSQGEQKKRERGEGRDRMIGHHIGG